MSTPESTVRTPTPALSQEDIEGIVSSFLSKHSAKEGTSILMTENYDLRAKNRALRDEVTKLTAKLPPDGAKVLTGDELRAYDAFVALGKTPDELHKALDDVMKLGDKVALADRTAKIVAAADAEGLHFTRLQKLLTGSYDIAVEEVEEGEGEEKTKAQHAFLVAKGSDGVVTKTKLTEHADIKEFLPSLRKEQSNGDDEQPTKEPTKGTNFVTQRVGVKVKPMKASTAFINKRYGAGQGAADRNK